MNKRNYPIIKSWKAKEGKIIHELKRQGGESQKIIYTAIRGGLGWPSVTQAGAARGYYCIVGQLFDERSRYEDFKDKVHLKFFCEHQSEKLMSRTDFLRKLSDDAKKFYCGGFYTDTSEANEARVDAFHKYINDNKLREPYINLQQAPFMEDFQFGLEQINAWLEEDKIEIPSDSLVYKQLKNIEESHLQNSPELQFNAINALRFVVGSFYKSPPSFGGGFIPKRRRIPFPAGGSRNRRSFIRSF